MKSSTIELIIISGILSIGIIIFSALCTNYAVAVKNETLIINETLLDQQTTNPLIGAFYYGWFKGKDGNYQAWDLANHKPPSTWASNYLPDTEPGVFDPTNELYNSNDTHILQKQLGWMKKAGIQFGISSWWGIGSTTDKVFLHIIKSVMPSATNPYPAFKWTLVYDLQGYTDPTLNEITTDLNYIKNMYTTSPYYLKIDGKPVIFVFNANYNGSRPLKDIETWSTARNLTGFYVVMLVNPQHVGENAHGIDGWYEYNTYKRYGELNGYYAYVTPGYWKYDENPLLTRNPSEFETAVQRLAAAKVHFKLIESWNEWAEGTQVEPGQSILHADNDSAFRPSAPSYGDTYLNILGKYFAASR